jgi:calcineurin-like phosphoesterase family protein
MKNTFISSDHHFGHRNVLQFCSTTRPFDTVEEMNEGLITRHNEVVKPKDDVYFLGDFAFMPANQIEVILERMHGNKHFVFGNHDKPMRQPSIVKHFVWMKDYHELRLTNHKQLSPVVLFHFPIHSWNRMHYGALHFYGHTHGTVPEMAGGRARDVGVDSNNCYPWNVVDLVALMEPCAITDPRAVR